jgi:hypothetical protein
MNGLFAAAREAQQFFRGRRWRFCIIGGLAVARWGHPRATQDVDISLLAGLGREDKFVDPLLREFAGRMPDARAFALANRVVLCRASNGVALDIALAAFPFEEQVIARATPYAFASRLKLVTASAEDLVVLKAFAGRDQDWADVRGIVERHGDQLDWDYVRLELSGLRELKEDAGTLERLDELRRQAGEGLA